MVAHDNKAMFQNTDIIPNFTLNSIHIDPVFKEADPFRIEPKSGKKDAQLSASPSGSIESDITRDVLKVVVIDRHHGTKNCGIAFVRWFGLKRGAIACTTNCENQNLVVISTSDAEIAGAVKAIEELRGGFVAVLKNKVLGSVRVDVAGCMSSEPWEKVRDDSLACNKVVRDVLGCNIKSPFMIMSFVGLVGVPDLGLTELGLVDYKTQGLMDAVLSDEPGEAEEVVGNPKSVKICCRCPSHAHDVHRMMDSITALSA
jgi:adenine deaminase